MNKILLITSNENKVKEFKEVLEPEIQVIHKKLEYPELRYDTNKEIAEDSATRLAKQFNEPVVVEDSGIFIKALNGFPGTVSSYTYKRIGLKGILKLMKGELDRTAEYHSAIAYAEPNKQPISFEGTETGSLAKKEKGEHGWAHDKIFIPQGKIKTYAQMKFPKKQFRKNALLKLKQYILNLKA